MAFKRYVPVLLVSIPMAFGAAWIIAAVSRTQFTLTELTAFVVGTAGAITATASLLQAIRGQSKEQRTTVLASPEPSNEPLRVVIKELSTRIDEERTKREELADKLLLVEAAQERQNTEHAKERAAWEQERAEWHIERDQLQREVARIPELEREIAELREQLNGG
jgi:chromosome segregation ATPase